jgi:hypothetical protein
LWEVLQKEVANLGHLGTIFSCHDVQAGKSGSGDEKSMAYQLADANAALGKLGFEATHI